MKSCSLEPPGIKSFEVVPVQPLQSFPVFNPGWGFAKWQEPDFWYGWSCLAQSLITREEREVKQGMCQIWLSPMNVHRWPRRGRSRKELLMSGLALAPHPKWEVDNSRPLCIQSTLNYPRAESPLCESPLLPLSSLQLSALWPVSCPSEPQSEGGQVEEGRGCKVQISHFRGCSLDTCKRGRIIG